MIQGATVVHHIPGRVRVRVPHGRQNPQLLAEIRDFVRDLSGVRKVEINTTTGTIVVHYAPESEEHLQSLLRQDRPQLWLEPPELGDAGEIAEEVEAEAEFLAAHSETALAIVNFVKQLDSGIRQATGNAVDLKVLAPAGLAIWAFFKAGSEVSTPLWVTLAIFSINSFVTLHSPPSVRVSPREITS